MILCRIPLVVRTLALLACLALIALVVAQSAEATGAKAVTRACAKPKYPGEGYFTELTVKGTTCAAGKKLAVSYYKCRVRNGGREGACPRSTKVRGYSCKELRPASGMTPVEFNARVTCTRGAKRIVHSYQQNL